MTSFTDPAYKLNDPLYGEVFRKLFPLAVDVLEAKPSDLVHDTVYIVDALKRAEPSITGERKIRADWVITETGTHLRVDVPTNTWDRGSWLDYMTSYEIAMRKRYIVVARLSKYDVPRIDFNLRAKQSPTGGV